MRPSSYQSERTVPNRPVVDNRGAHLTSDGAGIRLWDGDLLKCFGVVLLCNLHVDDRL